MSILLFFQKINAKSLPFQGGFCFHGADTQSRTGDLILTKDALYQLSHISTLTGRPHSVRNLNLLSNTTLRCIATNHITVIA